jgi:hypothetical protein
MMSMNPNNFHLADYADDCFFLLRFLDYNNCKIFRMF